MDNSCFVYINLNSPQNEVEVSPEIVKVKHHNSSKKQHKQHISSPNKPNEKLVAKHSKHKKTRHQYFSEVGGEINPEYTEKKPEKKLKKEVKKPVTQSPVVRKTKQVPVECGKLSLDDYLKKIEMELNLEEFTHKAENFQKDLNFIEGNIHDNKILEELNADSEEKFLSNQKNLIKPKDNEAINQEPPIKTKTKDLESIFYNGLNNFLSISHRRRGKRRKLPRENFRRSSS